MSVSNSYMNCEIPSAKEYVQDIENRKKEEKRIKTENEHSRLLNSFIQSIIEKCGLPFEEESSYSDFLEYPKLSILTEKG
jgi:hypothetical protein